MVITPSTLAQNIRAELNTSRAQEQVNRSTNQISSGAEATNYAESKDSGRMVRAEAKETWTEHTIRQNELEGLKLRDAETAIQSVVNIAQSLYADTVGANNDAKPDNSSFPLIAQNALEEMVRQLNVQDSDGNYILGGTKIDFPPAKLPEIHTLTGTKVIPGATNMDRDSEAFAGNGILNIKIRDNTTRTTAFDVTINLTNPPSQINTMGELRTTIQDAMAGAGLGGFTVDYTASGALQFSTNDPNLGIMMGTGQPAPTLTGTTPIPGADDPTKDAVAYTIPPSPDSLTLAVRDKDTNMLLKEVSVDLSAVTNMGELRIAVAAAMTPHVTGFTATYDAGGHLQFSTNDSGKLLILGGASPAPTEATGGLGFEQFFELPKIDYYQGNDVTDLVTADHAGFEKVLRGALMAATATTSGSPDNAWLGAAADLLMEGITEISNGPYSNVLNEQRDNERAKKDAQQNHDLAREEADDIRATKIFEKIVQQKNQQIQLQLAHTMTAKMQHQLSEFVRNFAAQAA